MARPSPCHRIEMRLGDLVEARTPEAEDSRSDLESLRRHVAYCDRCQWSIATYRATLTLLGKLPEVDLPPDFLGWVGDRIDAQEVTAEPHRSTNSTRRLGVARMALAACLVAAAALLVYSGWLAPRESPEGVELADAGASHRAPAPPPGPKSPATSAEAEGRAQAARAAMSRPRATSRSSVAEEDLSSRPTRAPGGARSLRRLALDSLSLALEAPRRETLELVLEEPGSDHALARPPAGSKAGALAQPQAVGEIEERLADRFSVEITAESPEAGDGILLAFLLREGDRPALREELESWGKVAEVVPPRDSTDKASEALFRDHEASGGETADSPPSRARRRESPPLAGSEEVEAAASRREERKSEPPEPVGAEPAEVEFELGALAEDRAAAAGTRTAEVSPLRPAPAPPAVARRGAESAMDVEERVEKSGSPASPAGRLIRVELRIRWSPSR